MRAVGVGGCSQPDSFLQIWKAGCLLTGHSFSDHFNAPKMEEERWQGPQGEGSLETVYPLQASQSLHVPPSHLPLLWGKESSGPQTALMQGGGADSAAAWADRLNSSCGRPEERRGHWGQRSVPVPRPILVLNPKRSQLFARPSFTMGLWLLPPRVGGVVPDVRLALGLAWSTEGCGRGSAPGSRPRDAVHLPSCHLMSVTQASMASGSRWETPAAGRLSRHESSSRSGRLSERHWILLTTTQFRRTPSLAQSREQQKEDSLVYNDRPLIE